MGNPAGYPAGLPVQQQADGEGPGAAFRLPVRLQPYVLQMGLRLGVQEHGAENPAEPEEILVLQPCRAAALVDLHTQPVAPLLDIGRQIKVRRGEAVLAIAHKLPVEPDVERLLHALEADADPLSPQAGFQVKFPHIAAHGVAGPVDLRGPQPGAAIPGVERVDILDLPKALQFDVPRHLDRAKGGAVVPRLPEVRRAGGRGLAPRKAPHPVQALAQGGFPLCHLLGGGVAYVVGVGVQPVHLEYSGIVQPSEICLHGAPSPISQFSPGAPAGSLCRPPARGAAQAAAPAGASPCGGRDGGR